MNLVRMTSAAVVLVFVFLVGPLSLHGATEPFPMPDVIAPNVAFWTKVYAQYSTRQAIVHDDTDLNIIYEVIDLLPYDAAGAEEINRARMKKANTMYADILKKLGQDPQRTEPECRRVAALFDFTSDANTFAAAAGRVRCQMGQRDRFQAGLIRSGAYREKILEILKSYDLPEDIAYLPHVESSFNPNAYSKFGAAGLWQFTRSTGKRFMEVGYVLDERRDPVRATHAAAQLLKENYEKLGSWPLAITAYNHGAAGMERAKRNHGRYVDIFKSYRSPSFKFASRNFYPEFLAARSVAAQYKTYFGELELEKPAPIRTVVLEGYASFAELSRHFKIGPQELKQMNPALRPPVFSGQKHVPKGYALRLPVNQTGKEPILVASIPDDLYNDVQKRSRFYTVQPGDTAIKIARLNGIKLEELISANDLNTRAVIYPRQTLRIPKPDEKLILQAAVQTAPPKAMKPEPSAEAPLKMAEPAPAAAPAPQQPPIAQHYPQPMLASIIPLPLIEPPAETEDIIDAAAQLQARNEEVVTAGVQIERIVKIHGRPAAIIQVEVEETLGHYAEWADVRTQQIRRLNGLRYGGVLHLGQEIKIPLQRVGAEAFAQNRYEYHKRLQEDFFAVYRVGELQAYKVQKGDTLWTLCHEKFQLPIWLLKHVNPEIDLADLRVKQQLVIPSIEKASSDDADPGLEEGEPETTDPQSSDGDDS